jgi:hypothetical protein
VREKLGMAAFVVLLVAVWGVGFLWFRGDLDFGAEPASAGKVQPSTTATPSASADPADDAPAAPSEAPYTGTINPADERKAVDVNPVAVRPRPLALPPVAQFTMASFNLLGSSHTKGGGERARLGSGVQRMNGALAVIAGHGISVVGLQEFQPDQRAAFASRAKGWAMYPGLSLGRRAGENSVAWRLDTWELVKPGLVPIPYFNGNIRPMPYVLLRHKATGVQAYFSTFHNPADTGRFQGQQRHRTEATTRQIRLFNQLESTGIPQFVTGDMNEREEYFCRVTGSTPLIAAAGGSNNGGCAVPKPTQIDWIFGSPGVVFGGYTIDRSDLVRRTTDHPVIVTQVVVDALKFKNAYDPQAATTP